MNLVELARRHLTDGAVPEHLLSGLPPAIQRSWLRCLHQGARPQEAVAFDAVSSADQRRLLEQNQGLLQAATPVIRSLARAMADTRYFAILTNRQGVVLDVHGPIDHADPHAHAIARVGVDLSEHAIGTTAIGTTLSEQQPVWLHRGEHFYDSTAVYSCAGAPLWGPDGRCIGMLDLTGVWVPERPALKHLVSQSARSIENALVLALPHALLLRLNWPGRMLGDTTDGLLSIDSDGQIAGANRAAIDMLSLEPGTAWPSADSLFALPTGQLFDLARRDEAATEIPLWCGLRLQVMAIRPHPSPHALPGRSHRDGVSLRQAESALIRKAVEDAGGNVAEAARVLGISRATVYRKLAGR